MIIGICGVGNFGYALLKHLDNKYVPNEVQLRAYDYDDLVIRTLRETHSHPYLFKEVKLSQKITYVDSYQALAQDCDVIVLAVSSSATRAALSGLKPYLKPNVILVNTAKALDFETGKRLSEIVKGELANLEYTYSAFSGGTIAKDLFAHQPLGVDIASETAAILPRLADIFTAENLYVNTSGDLVGTELAGAFKNIISLLAGIVKGLGFSYGSETRLISTTAQTIANVCIEAYGAQPATFGIGSQCWGNDMWMSATGQTRNRQFGELLGSGLAPAEAKEKMKAQHKTIESVQTLEALEYYPEILAALPVLADLRKLLNQELSVDQLRNSLFRHS